jgi:4a-hydroxytetrahydrobiopterin dehydratase
LSHHPKASSDCRAKAVFAHLTDTAQVVDAIESEGNSRKKDSIMNELAQKECVPCKGGTPPLKGDELHKMAAKLGGSWRVVNEHYLEKEFKFKDFREALAFTNKVGELAEKIGHHPDIYLAWGRVKLTIWTHKIDGLAESDFIFAAKVDEL